MSDEEEVTFLNQANKDISRCGQEIGNLFNHFNSVCGRISKESSIIDQDAPP